MALPWNDLQQLSLHYLETKYTFNFNVSRISKLQTVANICGSSDQQIYDAIDI